MKLFHFDISRWEKLANDFKTWIDNLKKLYQAILRNKRLKCFEDFEDLEANYCH